MKRRNVSPNTVKHYLNSLKLFVLWLDEPIEKVTDRKIDEYMDELLGKRLKPKTVNCYLNSICQFYHYLCEEEGIRIVNPVKKPNIMKLPRGLPKHLRDEHIEILFKHLKGRRDQAIFTLMLRCGLRVEEVAHLSLSHIDLKRRMLLIQDGKGAKDRIVYLSNDALHALLEYLRVRPANKVKKGFSCRERASQRATFIHSRHPETDGILCPQNKLENLLSPSSPYDGNADVECGCGLSTIQDLLGHNSIRTTQRYCRVSNLKVQRDYYKAMEVIMQRTAGNPNNP